jgi:cell division protein FtsW
MPKTLSNEAAHSDRQLVLYIGALVVLGLAILTSASGPLGYYSSVAHDSYFFVKRQLLFGCLPGIFFFAITSRIPTLWWKNIVWFMYLATVVLLVLVFVPSVGLTINGSHSWLSFFGFTFQPAELAKLTTVVVLATLLTNQKKDWRDWQTHVLPILMVLGVPLLLVLLQGDLGSATIIGFISLIMLYVGRVPGRYVGIIMLAATVAGLVLIVVAPHRVNRILVFINPDWVTESRYRYQIDQASLAVGSGGIWGLGFGHSRQKYQYLPEVNADSIFAIFAEENGFVGSVVFLALLLLIGWRGLKIAANAPDEMGKLLATGVMVWFMWQSFLNIGGIVRAVPLTGVPLPLVSHGGSAYMMMLGALGIVVGVSKTMKVRD